MGIIRRDIYSLEENAIALVFDQLSHPGRVKTILMLLLNESLSLGEIQQGLGLSQSATSDQVRILKDTGLITGVQLGTSVRYSLNRATWDYIQQLNASFWAEVAPL